MTNGQKDARKRAEEIKDRRLPDTFGKRAGGHAPLIEIGCANPACAYTLTAPADTVRGWCWHCTMGRAFRQAQEVEA